MSGASCVSRYKCLLVGYLHCADSVALFTGRPTSELIHPSSCLSLTRDLKVFPKQSASHNQQVCWRHKSHDLGMTFERFTHKGWGILSRQTMSEINVRTNHTVVDQLYFRMQYNNMLLNCVRAYWLHVILWGNLLNQNQNIFTQYGPMVCSNSHNVAQPVKLIYYNIFAVFCFFYDGDKEKPEVAQKVSH